MSDLRVTNLKGRNPGEAPTLPDGVVITGITTVSSVIVGTGITLSSSGINVSGIITATSFFGSGANLTGVSGVSTTGSVNTSGIITATSIVVSAGTTALPSISPTGDSNTGIFFPSADTIAFAEGGAEAMRVDSSGRLLIGISTSGNANGGPLQLSGGITFPATAVAASDANTLDDYEEGTWTVTATPQTSGTITLAINTGYYTKVGRLVVAIAKLTVSAVSSPIGFIKISLPFTVGTPSGSANVIMENTANSTSVTGFWTIVPTADTGLGMYLSAATNPSATSAQQVTVGSAFWFTATYFI